MTAEREVMVHESELLWREGDRAGLRFVCSRAPTCARWSRPSAATPTAWSCGAWRSVPSRPPGAWDGRAGRGLDVETAWAAFGAVVVLDADEAAAAGHGRPIAGARIEAPVLLVDPAGRRWRWLERDGALRVEVGLRG